MGVFCTGGKAVRDAKMLSATMAMRMLARLSQLDGQASSRALIFRGGSGEGRHHSRRGHADYGTSAASTLGGGWAGRLIFSRWSRRA